MIDRVNILGVEVSAIDMPMALARFTQWIEQREPHYVCVTGVHGIIESRRDPSLREIHNRAGLVTPDGMPLVWTSHAMGRKHVRRVYGPDLMLAAFEAGVARNWRHFLFGGGPSVADKLASRLCAKFPGARIAGTHTPPFRATSKAEEAAVVEEIKAARADILWVGLGTPKQERWMADHVGSLEIPVLVGVGAAFDFHAGVKRQAPRWLRQSGLEWAFRMACEPRRLWKRYLVNNSIFAVLMAMRFRTMVREGK